MAVKNKTPVRQGDTKTYLTIGGLLIVFGWALLLAATNWLMYFPCTLSPQNCEDGELFAKIILYTPAVLGAALASVGITHNAKMTWIARLGVIVLVASVLLFLAFWFLVFVGIGIHGLKG